jgi:uncharacterized protein YaiI (UPF0178 family)
MKIWVDADACPVAVREILLRAAARTQTSVTFVANQALPIPASPFVSQIQVASGYDVADNEIVRRCAAGDLVITGDIPLADEVIDKGCLALNTRGELLTRENIRARLNMRDFMETLRSSGVQTGGPAALSAAEKQAFANRLDSWLAKKRRRAAD